MRGFKASSISAIIAPLISALPTHLLEWFIGWCTFRGTSQLNVVLFECDLTVHRKAKVRG